MDAIMAVEVHSQLIGAKKKKIKILMSVYAGKCLYT